MNHYCYCYHHHHHHHHHRRRRHHHNSIGRNYVGKLFRKELNSVRTFPSPYFVKFTTYVNNIRSFKCITISVIVIVIVITSVHEYSFVHRQIKSELNQTWAAVPVLRRDGRPIGVTAHGSQTWKWAHQSNWYIQVYPFNQEMVWGFELLLKTLPQ